VCCKWLQGIAGGVGRSFGMDRLTDGLGFGGCDVVEKAPSE
jgi:hypothetical protein